MCLQGRLTGRLAGLYEEGKGLRDTLRLALVAVGRGGQGDVGQRIRDEILTVQSNNGAKVSCFVSFACCLWTVQWRGRGPESNLVYFACKHPRCRSPQRAAWWAA